MKHGGKQLTVVPWGARTARVPIDWTTFQGHIRTLTDRNHRHTVVCATHNINRACRTAATRQPGHHHHVTNQAIASMPSTPRPTGAEGRGSTAPECLQVLRTSQACTTRWIFIGAGAGAAATGQLCTVQLLICSWQHNHTSRVSDSLME
jgi:hypothetical protein